MASLVTWCGFAGLIVGVGLQFGLPWGLMVGGAIAFVAGGVTEARR